MARTGSLGGTTAFYSDVAGFAGGGSSTAPTSSTETTVLPAALTARTDLDQASQALGKPLPAVIGTGRVDGVYVVGGVETISTVTTTTTKTPIQPQGTYIAVAQNPGAAQMGAAHAFLNVNTSTTTTASSTDTVTQTMAGYVLAYDYFERGYDLIRLEVDGDLVFDAENGIGDTITFRFYGGRHTSTDPILTEMIGANAGAYQNFVMVFIDGYPSDSPPSISAVISNAATDQAESARIEWTGDNPAEPLLVELQSGYQSAYDPTDNVILQAITTASSGLTISGIQLAVLDVSTKLERYRIPLEDTAAVASIVHVKALRNSGHALISFATGSPVTWGYYVYDIVTGKRVAGFTESATNFVRLWNCSQAFDGKYCLIGIGSGASTTHFAVIDIAAATIDVTSATGFAARSWIRGRETGGGVSFFGFKPGQAGPAGDALIYEYTFNGSTWTYRLVYTAPAVVEALHYDPLTEYLVVSHGIAGSSTIAYVLPDTGAVVDTFTATGYLFSNGYTVTAGVSWERYWPRPGFALFPAASTNDVYLIDIAEKTVRLYATLSTEPWAAIFNQEQWLYIVGTGNDVWIVYYLPNQLPGLVDLDEIVTDAMSLAGFGSPDLTFVGFDGLATWGFVVASDTTIQTVVRAISDIYGFAWCDTGSGFVFKKPGQGASLAIDAAFGTVDIVERDQPVMSQDEANIRTPSAVEMQYMSKEGPYKTRPTSFSMTTGVLNSITTPKFSTPILFSDLEAQRIVQEKFFEYQEKRRSHTLTVAPENITLLPGDVISFPSGTRTYITRVEEIGIDLRNMGVEISARDFQTDVETSVTAVTNTGLVYTLVYFASQYIHLDMPLLDYGDDTAGASLVQYGVLVPRGQTAWSGASLWRGPTATVLAAIFDQLPHDGVMGVCETALATPADPFALTDTSTLTIRRITGSGLVDATEAEVLAGANNALIGEPGRWEWVGYRTVVDNLDGTYELSGFTLRGYRGSEVFCGLHAIGDIFITIDEAWTRRMAHPVSDLGDTFFYKAPGRGQDVTKVQAVQHVVTGAAETPYAPVNLSASIASPSGLDLLWNYRSRIATGLNPAIHGEDALGFEVDIYDDTTYLRTLTSATNSVHYATADVVADFGADPPDEIWIRVYMMSALPILVPGQDRPVEGRGYEASRHIVLTALGGVDVTGQTITVSVGTVTLPGAGTLAGVTGQSLTASVGSVMVLGPGGAFANVTGQGMTASVGNADANAGSGTAVSASVTGQAMTASVGTVTVTVPSGKALTYQGHAEDTGDLTTYTFSSKAIGIASADRRVHVGIGGTQGTRSISSVTIGGVTATANVAAQLGTVSTAAIYTANVPTGTTANIVVTWSGGQDRCGIFWWTSTGLTSDTAVGTDSAVNQGDNTLVTDMNVDVTTASGGFIIVYGVQHNSGGGTTITYSPSAIVADGAAVVIEATVIHYGAHGATDGSTFDVRTNAFGTGNGHSPMVAAAF